MDTGNGETHLGRYFGGKCGKIRNSYSHKMPRFDDFRISTLKGKDKEEKTEEEEEVKEQQQQRGRRRRQQQR